MLAVYLSIPQTENRRRALNTAKGIRRAKNRDHKKKNRK